MIVDYLKFIITSLFLIFILSCSENDPVTPSTVLPKVFIKSIEPNMLQVGMEFKIIVGVENGSIQHYYQQVLNNDLWHYADSIYADTFYTFAPYIPYASVNRIIEISVMIDSTIYKAKDTVYVFPNTCPQGVCIEWNDLDEISEGDSYFNGFNWSAGKSQDTVILKRLGEGCDEGYTQWTIKFLDNGISNLPTFISFRYDWYCMSEHKFTICDKAIIKIQDWDVNNVISGAIYSDITPNINEEMYPHRNFFWFDFSN